MTDSTLPAVVEAQCNRLAALAEAMDATPGEADCAADVREVRTALLAGLRSEPPRGAVADDAVMRLTRLFWAWHDEEGAPQEVRSYMRQLAEYAVAHGVVPVSALLYLRCMKHRNVPQLNREEMGGGECGACAYESGGEPKPKGEAAPRGTRDLLHQWLSVADYRRAHHVCEWPSSCGACHWWDGIVQICGSILRGEVAPLIPHNCGAHCKCRTVPDGEGPTVPLSAVWTRDGPCPVAGCELEIGHEEPCGTKIDALTWRGERYEGETEAAASPSVDSSAPTPEGVSSVRPAPGTRDAPGVRSEPPRETGPEPTELEMACKERILQNWSLRSMRAESGTDTHKMAEVAVWCIDIAGIEREAIKRAAPPGTRVKSAIRNPSAVTVADSEPGTRDAPGVSVERPEGDIAAGGLAIYIAFGMLPPREKCEDAARRCLAAVDRRDAELCREYEAWARAMCAHTCEPGRRHAPNCPVADWGLAPLVAKKGGRE